MLGTKITAKFANLLVYITLKEANADTMSSSSSMIAATSKQCSPPSLHSQTSSWVSVPTIMCSLSSLGLNECHPTAPLLPLANAEPTKLTRRADAAQKLPHCDVPQHRLVAPVLHAVFQLATCNRVRGEVGRWLPCRRTTRWKNACQMKYKCTYMAELWSNEVPAETRKHRLQIWMHAPAVLR
jgi:hypothetical protein